MPTIRGLPMVPQRDSGILISYIIDRWLAGGLGGWDGFGPQLLSILERRGTAGDGWYDHLETSEKSRFCLIETAYCLIIKLTESVRTYSML